MASLNPTRSSLSQVLLFYIFWQSEESNSTGKYENSFLRLFCTPYTPYTSCMSSDCLYIFSPLHSPHISHTYMLYIFACLYEIRAFVADRWNVDGRNVFSIEGGRRMDGWKMRKFRCCCSVGFPTPYGKFTKFYVDVVVDYIPPSLSLPFVHPHVKFPFSLDFCILSLYVFFPRS